MKDLFKGKTILVTGGAGSIGSQIVRTLMQKKPKKIIVFDIDDISLFMMQRELRQPFLEFVSGDVRDKESIERIFYRDQIDYVYHAAAMKHVIMCERSPVETVKTNVFGTQNLVDLAIKYNSEKMITFSTDKAADPSGVMGATKFIAERITLEGNFLSKRRTCFACVRFGNVANSEGSVVPVFIDNLKKQKELLITNLEVTRFTMRIADAVLLILKATMYAQGGEIFVFKMPAFRLGDLVDVMINRIAPRLNISNPQYKIEGLKGKTEKVHEKLIADLEKDYLLEKEDMYIITPRRLKNSSEILTYSSEKARRLSLEEIEEFILEYLREEK